MLSKTYASAPKLLSMFTTQHLKYSNGFALTLKGTQVYSIIHNSFIKSLRVFENDRTN